MELQEYLRQFAVKNIWCSPKQDRQHILKLARLTGYGGDRHRFAIGWITLNLPEDGNFHVYQIGQNCPFDLGLFPNRGEWIKVSDLCTTQGMVIDLYLNRGVQLPRTQSWICRTHDKNFVVCVKESLKIDDLNSETLNMRIYRNAYYGSERSDGKVVELVCRGGLMKSAADINILQGEIQALTTEYGYVSIWHNGRYVSNASTAKVVPGDTLEYLYDPSIVAVVDLPMASLPSFKSDLDKMNKFILHPPKRDDEVIYFRDDVDTFLIKKAADGVDGIFYHRNHENSMRMLTHRDYSIPTAYVNGFIQDDRKWKGNGNGIFIRLHIRESGYSRPLVHEHHRIHELYKLTDNKILRGMQGLDSVLKEWTASQLEASMYPYVMSAWYHEITPQVVIDALGYNSMSEIIGQTPTKTQTTPDGILYADLPWGLAFNSTIYEYDAEGLLLGWYRHNGNARYYPTNQNCVLVEGMRGQGTKQLDAWFGKVPVKLDPNFSYRYYISDTKGGATVNNWRQVKPEDGFYEIKDGVFQWVYDESRKVGVVVSDSKFLAYTLEMDQTDGFYRFHANYTDLQGIVMELPVGKIDLWLNRRSLIQNIDYYVQWPMVVIVNKEWLNPNGKNRFDVRCTDWADQNGQILEPADFGFVEHGLLSNNEIYNIRDDHVIRCVADGRVFHRDDLVFSEQKYGLKLKDKANLLDGRPYWISDVRVPLSGMDPLATDKLREKSQELDKRVGDYLAQQLVPPTFDRPATAKWRYRVYSPLITKLLNDIEREWFTPPQMPAPDSTVMESMAEYEYILPFEPARNDADDRYVTIHPHPWTKTREVTRSEYLYLQRISELYLHGRVDLTQFVTIKG
jgi:hypothetical protein